MSLMEPPATGVRRGFRSAALAGVALAVLAVFAPSALATGETREATEDGIRIRTAPSVDAPIVGHTVAGQRFQVLSEAEGGDYGPVCGASHDMWMWWRVEFNGREAFVAMGGECLAPVITPAS